MRNNSGINQSEHVDRSRRVAEVVQREVSDLIRTEFDDPRLDLVTVTDVRVTKDLKAATVYVSRADFIKGQTGNDQSGTASEGDAGKRANTAQPNYVVALNRAAARIRRLLARRMTTKTVPKLVFEFDVVLDQGHRISSIIDAVAGPSVDAVVPSIDAGSDIDDDETFVGEIDPRQPVPGQ